MWVIVQIDVSVEANIRESYSAILLQSPLFYLISAVLTNFPICLIPEI